MKIKKSYLRMVKAIPGGMAALAAAMGLGKKILENRIYEQNGQELKVSAALLIQSFSGTTYFAEAVAAVSGGTFIKLPSDLSDGNELLFKKFRQLHMEIGEMTKIYEDAVADDVITPDERLKLEMQGDKLHLVVAQFLALTFGVYCQRDAKEVAK